VVEEFENVLSAVNAFGAYVFGIVVLLFIYELIALFCAVVSMVKTPPLFVRPVPRREMNVWPPMERFVVEAAVKDAYVVEEYAKV
jgi:hypothetical protein